MNYFKSLPDAIFIGEYKIKLKIRKLTRGRDDVGSTTMFRQHWGEWDVSKLTISLHPTQPSAHFALDTVIHEINHAIYAMYGFCREMNEERFVGMISTAWV